MLRPPHRCGPKRAGPSLLLAICVVLVPACTRDINLLGFGSGGVSGTAGEGAIPSNGGTNGQGGQHGDASVGDASAACLAGGEPMRLATATGPVCAATLAARTHRFALCGCGDWNVTAPVFTDALSSRPGMPADPTSAAIGINGNLTTASALADIWARGSLYVAGSKGIVARGHLDVGRTLQSAGPVTQMTPQPSNVWSDAYVAGDISGPLSIGGTLHLSPTSTVGALATSAATSREAIAVVPPCDCGPIVDIATSLANAMAKNDNASIQLSPDRLAAVTVPVSLDLPCGVFALSSISADATVTLSVHGRALLAISGDIVVHGGLMVFVDPGVSLDLLLGGSLTSIGPMPVGSPTGAVFRLWVKGAGPIIFEDKPVVGAIIYAPGAPLSATRGIEMYGAIVAANLAFGDQVSLHFDEAVLGTGCGDPKVESVP